MSGGVVERDRERPGCASDLSAQHALGWQRVGLECEHDRFAFIEIRDGCRELFEPRPSGCIDGDVVEHRMLKLFEQTIQLVLHLVYVADVGEGAAACFGSLPHQVTVGRGADSDGEQASAAHALVQQFEELLLIADLSIGDENDLLEPCAVLRALEGLSQSRKYFRSPVGRELFGVPDGLLHRCGRHGLRYREQRPDRMIELNDVEAILCGQPCEGGR